MRYYQRISANSSNQYCSFGFIGGTANGSTTTAYIYKTLPVPLRVPPTATSYGGTVALHGLNDSRYNISAMGVLSTGTNEQTVGLVITSSGLTANAYYDLGANNSTTAYVEVVAEL